jgi:DNA polymerase
MNNTTNLLKLKRAYALKALGYNYIEHSKPIKIDSNKELPNSLTLLKEITHNCHLCELSKTRKNVVFGEGNESAEVMFVGEGPGFSEDESGKPFVGRAGELLTKMIESVLEIKREEVYIANIVKCRPPNNRVPTPEEAINCKEYLLKQIELVNPKIIVALGDTSSHSLTDDSTPITKIRGEVLEFNNSTLIPTFHPSYLLRNPSAKREAFVDMKKIREMMG